MEIHWGFAQVRSDDRRGKEKNAQGNITRDSTRCTSQGKKHGGIKGKNCWDTGARGRETKSKNLPRVNSEGVKQGEPKHRTPMSQPHYELLEERNGRIERVVRAKVFVKDVRNLWVSILCLPDVELKREHFQQKAIPIQAWEQWVDVTIRRSSEREKGKGKILEETYRFLRLSSLWRVTNGRCDSLGRAACLQLVTRVRHEEARIRERRIQRASETPPSPLRAHA